MIRFTQAILLTLLCGLSFSLLAEEVQPKNLEKIVALQRRADTLAFSELGSSNYHLAKARAWLNMATSEYYQVDTSGVMFGAMTQAETILTALENKQLDISVDMPADFPNVEKVRPDLWDKITAIKSKANYACGQRLLAEAEVQLIWAGHEKVESGWNHAESYARISEDLLSEAQVAINICNTTVAVTPKDTPPEPVISVPAMAAIEKITLSGDALFALGKSTLNPSAKPSLDELAIKIKKMTSLDEIMLVGHTDRLSTYGHPERNQTLSEDRAYTVKLYLIGKGIAGNIMHASGAGSTQPIVQCNDKKMNKNKTKLANCLQPNRRVEIIFHGVK